MPLKALGSSKLINYFCLLFVVVGFSFFIILSNRPFGWLFWSCFYLAMLGLAGLMFNLFFSQRAAARLWKKILAWLSGLSAIAILGFCLCLISGISLSPKASIPANLSQQQWDEDLEFLLHAIAEQHPSHLSVDSNVEFKNFVDDLKARFPQLTTEQKVIALSRVVAHLNDGHSSIWPLYSPVNFRAFPLKTYTFANGLYIIDTSRQYQQMIGSKIVQIGDTPIETVASKLATISGAENAAGKKVRLSLYLMVAELLEAEGVIDSADRAKLTLENSSGERYQVEVEPESADAWFFWYFYRFVDNKASPAFHNLRPDFYWFEYQKETKTIYFQFNLVQNDILFGESLESFSRRLNEFANSVDFDRFVIDIRNNNGGDGSLLHPLIETIANNKKINQKGKLFTIIGRNTFSAAVMFAAAMENRTKTLFVGESMGAGLNHTGDAESIYLPNSGIRVLLSQVYWQNGIAEDKRPTIQPDLMTHTTFQDFLEHNDPAMSAILSYQYQPKSYPTIEYDFPSTTARYLISPFEAVIFHKENNKLSFRMTDFSGINFAEVTSELYPTSSDSFDTDINQVTLNRRINSHGQTEFYFKWFGIEKPLTPVPEDFKLPLKSVLEGNIDAAITTMQQGYDLPMHLKNETVLNNFGYSMLEREPEIATNLFKLNVRLHQGSPNTYDSLAEALQKTGNEKMAKFYYQKSKELTESANSMPDHPQ